jgi:hypothetical protein
MYVFFMFVWYREAVSQLPTTSFDSHLYFIWPEMTKQVILQTFKILATISNVVCDLKVPEPGFKCRLCL